MCVIPYLFCHMVTYDIYMNIYINIYITDDDVENKV